MGPTSAEHGNRRDRNGVSRRGFGVASLGTCLPAFASAAVPVVPLAMSETVDLGFVTPLLTLLEPSAGLQWERSSVPFSRMLHMVEQGTAVGFGISPTVSRAERLRFTSAVFKGAVWAISRRDRRLDVRGIEQLKGRTVCKSRQVTYGSEFEDAVFDGMDVQAVQGDLSQRLRLLLAGRCDVMFVTTRNAGADSLRARIEAAGEDMQAFTVGSHPLIEQGVHFAAAKDGRMSAWIPRIEAAIQAQRPRIQQLAAAAG